MEASQQFHLKWNNHSLNTLSSFQQLLDTNTLVDVTLTCSNGKMVTAHRMVLAACSEYFYRLFKDLPEKHPVIVFKDAGEEIVRDLLLFMYKGEVEVQEAYLNDFLKFADTLQVKGLSQSDREEAAARAANEQRSTEDGPAVAKFEAQTTPIKSNSSSLPPLSGAGMCVPPPPPPAHSLPDMAKSYLAAAGLASGKFPPLFPLPNEPASATDLLSQFSSPNLYRALHRKYQSIGGPKFSEHDNPMLKQMPFLKKMFGDHPMGDLGALGHPMFQAHAQSLPKDDNDSDGIAERSPPPHHQGTPGSGNNQDENGLSDNNGPSPMEGDFNTPPPGGESRSNTPGSNHNMDDLQSQRNRGGGKHSSGRGSRLERMIAAEYKILNEFSDSAPEALPVMTPELMKSRRTHSLQLAIGEILHNRASVQSAATKYHIPRETLRRHYQRYLKAMGIQKPPQVVGGGGTVRSSVPINNNAKTPALAHHSTMETQGTPTNTTASSGDESNGFSSLMDIGAAYGIWNPDVDGSDFKYKFKDLEARRAAIEAATAAAAAHAAAMAAATSCGNSGSDNEARGEKEEKEKDLVIDEDEDEDDDDVDDDDDEEPNPGSPEPPHSVDPEEENGNENTKENKNRSSPKLTAAAKLAAAKALENTLS
ncbi:broad-complex core protein isoforms 1/2/3/4/5-like [Tigriopus californicus]|uniref:broad-complex core protein isoforms 1/2/3/4/5-like n=1 Tax=Tigriopus californicus TaxID=6832 RepID=UPI0027D9DB1B|nr:broad-complex core protein isoforms 1/2/3/4/5-like [Tigriopus californicus]XP_059089818.1 broad-complex core protein isoforms 1/2/3/4/5-like [Tigriopus californicus]XP_059089826.1 broad-complex core protein isoforms 1/2/3/4/5-like [Tigriopus californicus]